MPIKNNIRQARAARFAMRWIAVVILACLASITQASAADLRMDRVTNKGTVQLMTEGSAGASIRMAEDLAAIIDDGATRRVLPVVGRTELQNLADLISLRGIDMAVLQIDVLEGVRQQRAVVGLESNFFYVTRLYNKELHVLARRDIRSIADLAGQKVNMDVRGSGTSVTAGRLFELLKVTVQTTNDPSELALEKLRQGEIAAVAFVSTKPAGLFRAIKPEEGLHLVPIPLAPPVIEAYLPTSLSADDYPGLVADSQPIDTIAVGTLLAVATLPPESERYRNVANIIDVFFTEFRSLMGPGRHPKWREVSLTADAKGWRRFPPAQQWLDRNRAVASQTPQDARTMFTRFLESRQQIIGGSAMSDQQKRELFEEFQRWQTGRNR